MNKSFSVVVLCAALQACTTTAPKPTPAELAARKTSTLNVYDNNRVAIKTATTWTWTNSTSEFLALEVDGRAYNVKDISSVAPLVSKGRSQSPMQVLFASGTKVTTPLENLRWLACDIKKRCQDAGGLDTIMMAISIKDLNNPSGITLGFSSNVANPRTAMMKDSRALPNLKLDTDFVKVLSATETAELDAKVAGILKQWDDRAPEREAAQTAIKKQRDQEESRRIAALRDEKIGTQAYCETRATSSPEMTPTEFVTCSRYGGTDLSELLRLGWNIVSDRVRSGTDDLGVLTFYTHGLTIRKIR